MHQSPHNVAIMGAFVLLNRPRFRVRPSIRHLTGLIQHWYNLAPEAVGNVTGKTKAPNTEMQEAFEPREFFIQFRLMLPQLLTLEAIIVPVVG